jgi:hypothetical protein
VLILPEAISVWVLRYTLPADLPDPTIQEMTVHNGAVDEINLIVFADGTVLGRHPGIRSLPHGFSAIDIGGDEVQDCVARSFVNDYGKVRTGHGSYLVTATLRCLGLGVRPGATVAMIRASATDQSSIVFHQSPVPPGTRNVALVAGWPAPAWAERVHAHDIPHPSPVTDWPVNAALRAIGVDRGDHPDESSALHLNQP